MLDFYLYMNLIHLHFQGSNLGSYSDVCREMSCYVPGGDSTYRVYKAATGTSCGDKKVRTEAQNT